MPPGAGTLATELRRRLGPPPAPGTAPLVSIVVVNHDGVEHLRRLLPGLSDRTDYPHFELIVVDNGSRDDSVALLRSGAWSFPVCVVENPGNESFSDACNQGAAEARGELLLFLNNDTEPFESGWLHELVACLLDSGAGAVGATLIFPHEDLERFPHGFAVQHRGLRFRDEQGTIGPALHGWEADPLDERLGEDLESPVVVAACLLVEAALFERVGGFTHGFLYGSEDIDLCFKLRAAGRSVICSGRSLVIHRPESAQRALASANDTFYAYYVGPPHEYDTIGAMQFRLLTAFGLRAHHRLLDFGCGSLRAGRLLIPYLNPGNYFGIEPNRWLVEEGVAKQVGADQIEIKRPTFSWSDDFTTDHLHTRFDYILAQSIFSHTGPDLVQELLGSLRRSLEPDGIILATFVEASWPAKEAPRGGWIYPATVSYRRRTVRRLAARAGLHVARLRWRHPRQTWYAFSADRKRLPGLVRRSLMVDPVFTGDRSWLRRLRNCLH